MMMKKWITNLFLVFLMIFTFIVNGCGGTNTASPTAPAKVSGVAATGAPVSGTITAKDSSVPPKTTSTTTAHNGSFSLNVAGFQAPYVLKAAWNQNGNAEELYALADGPGTTNINPLTNAAFAAAANVSDPEMFNGDPDAIVMQAVRNNKRSVMQKIKLKLAQLFELYGVTKDAETDEYEADHTGLDALFDDVTITVSHGTVIVTNKKTGGVIFQAPVNNINSGTFFSGNMPGQPGQVDGVALYAANCSSCHGPLASSAQKGVTASAIQSAIKNNTGGMGSLATLTALQVQAIAASLAGNTVPPPPTTPPDGAALYVSKCAGCHGPLVTSSKKNKSATTIQNAINSNTGGMGSLSSLTSAEVTAIAAALVVATSPPPAACTYSYSAWGTCQSSNTQTRSLVSSTPAGCTGTPALSQVCIYTPPVTACTSFTYSAWGACLSNNTQTRTVATSSPAGCTGGTPVLSQACTYVPPVTACTSFTYSAWGACLSNNTQTRTVATSSPGGCTGGTPVLAQACTSTPPSTLTLAQVTSSCTGCHGLTSNTTVLRSGGYTVTGRTAAVWLTTVNNMVGMGASLASGKTAQDYANFLAGLP